MSIGAVGALGATGFRSMNVMSAGGRAGAHTPVGLTMRSGSANLRARQAGAQQSLPKASSTSVNISSAARTSLASDGLQTKSSMGELAQALIIALMLQMLQGTPGK